MKVLERPGTDPAQVVLFMPTADGPCRFGQYAPYLRRILEENGYHAANRRPVHVAVERIRHPHKLSHPGFFRPSRIACLRTVW